MTCACGCGVVLSAKSRSGYTTGHNPFCRRGHDTRIVGRLEDGKRCGECTRDKERARYIRTRRRNPAYMAQQTTNARARYDDLVAKAAAYDVLMKRMESA